MDDRILLIAQRLATALLRSISRKVPRFKHPLCLDKFSLQGYTPDQGHHGPSLLRARTVMLTYPTSTFGVIKSYFP